VEITDVGVRLGDDLAVQLQHQTEHAVGAGVGRADVEDEPFADIELRGHFGGARQRVAELQRGGGGGAHRLLSSAGRARGSRSWENGAGLVTKGPPSSGAFAVKAISGISVGSPSKGKSFRKG